MPEPKLYSSLFLVPFLGVFPSYEHTTWRGKARRHACLEIQRQRSPFAAGLIDSHRPLIRSNEKKKATSADKGEKLFPNLLSIEARRGRRQR